MQFRKGYWTIVILMLLAGRGVHALVNGMDSPAHKAACDKNGTVTAVRGESWLAHLNRPFSETSMGKTGHLGPGPEEKPTLGPAANWFLVSSQGATLHGADLYRLNCQGCHGESGQGAPPEINSVINPVRATSVALVMERMKTSGMEISHADAVKLAQQANAALLQRLRQGGKNMPPFPHLNDPEIRSLMVYLQQLAGVPGAGGQQVAVSESQVRIGEHIVKSTCHTCHSAAGADPDPKQLEDGAIPPLSVLTARKSQPEFIRKVTHGAPILMGAPAMLYRGRMPVFYYLSEQEAADVYLYLTLYPPSESNDTDTLIAVLQQGRPNGGGSPLQRPGSDSSASSGPLAGPEPDNSVSLRSFVLLSGIGAFVVLLLAGGLGFTMREFQRLAMKTKGHQVMVRNPNTEPGVTRPVGAIGASSRAMSLGIAKRQSH